VLAHNHPVHRKWNECNKKVVWAWVESCFEYSSESSPNFVARIHAALSRILHHEGNVIVFLQRLPSAFVPPRLLDRDDGRAMWLAAVLMNASFTT
jgi:hypothetical protein